MRAVYIEYTAYLKYPLLINNLCNHLWVYILVFDNLYSVGIPGIMLTIRRPIDGHFGIFMAMLFCFFVVMWSFLNIFAHFL